MSGITDIEKVLSDALEKAAALEGAARHDVARLEDAVKTALGVARSTVAHAAAKPAAKK